jgi:major type 1 subunit fimbrin (pilin)
MAMKKFFSAAAMGAALIAITPLAHAFDGTITFDGEVVADTCTVSTGTSGDFSVSLPKVPATSLAAAGQWAGRTPFQINLVGCSGANTLASAYFEPSGSVNPVTGRLLNDTGAGQATGVEIGLLNDTYGSIFVGGGVLTNNGSAVDVSSGSGDLQYFAQYEATAPATVGLVNSRVQYTLIYQ